MNTTQLIAAKTLPTQRKRAFTIKRLIDVVGQTISFAAYDSDGKPVGGMHCRFDARKASDTNRHYAMLFGFNQSIGDTAALGQGATLADKFKEMKDRIKHFESGSDSWTGTQRDDSASLLVQALLREKPERDPIKTAAFVKGLARSKREKMANSERLREIMDELRSELGKEVDVDAEFAELDAMG